MSNPLLRGRLAGANPHRLPLHPGFWKRQPVFLLILAGSAAMLWGLAPFTYSFGEGIWGLLPLPVQLLALWGVAITARSLAGLEVDSALVDEIEARGAAYLVDVKSERGVTIELVRLEGRLVPNNPSTPLRGPIRLVQHVCKEAADRRFESAGNLVQPYRDEALEDVFRLQNLQKIALWLGILGTFVGLLVALQERAVGAPDGDELLRMVDEMYGGLFISFTASVAGLEVAIILGFLVMLLRKRHEGYLTSLEAAALTVLSVARHCINRDEVLAELTQVSSVVRDLGTRVHTHTTVMGEALMKVREQLGNQNERLEAGMQRLAAARGEFNGFLDELGDGQRAFLDDLRTLFQTASFRDFTQALETGVAQAGTEVSARLEGFSADNKTQLAAVAAAVEGLTQAVDSQSQALTRAVEALGTRLADTGVTMDLRRLSGNISELNHSLERLGAGPAWPQRIRELLTGWLRPRRV